jgi:predicted porin
VTLYGRIDASVGVSKNTVTNVSTSKVFNGSDAGLSGSRWGIQGTEDLGGGLKAVFRLENRLNVDTGADTAGFTGDAFVGLTGGFGTVHLGRSYNAYDYTQDLSTSSNVYESAFTADFNPGNYTRSANMIKYVSPTIDGFTVVASSGLNEGADVDVATGKNTNGVSVGYAAGPLGVRVGAQTAINGDSTSVAAAYNFGILSVSGGYNQLSGINNGDDSKGILLGVNMPMGAFNFSVGYAAGDVETNAGVKVSETSGVGLGATYSLSKRTTLYAGLKNTKTENAAGAKTAGTRLYAAGVRHNF